MNLVCPFCGAGFDPAGADPGETAGTVLCPTCWQELDLAAQQQPTSSASPDIAGFHPPPEPPSRHEPIGSPPPPPRAPELDPGRTGADKAEAAEPASHSPAWEDDSASYLAGLWRTIWQVLLHPVLTLGAPAKPGLGHALSFALIIGTLGTAANFFWDGMEDSYDGYLVWLLVTTPLMVVAGLFFSSAAAHVSLWILRGAKNGFQATFRVMGYGHATSMFMLIPVLGLWISAVWSIVVMVGGLAGAHGISKLRAFAALVLPIFILVFLGLLAVMAVMAIALVAGQAMPDLLKI